VAEKWLAASVGTVNVEAGKTWGRDEEGIVFSCFLSVNDFSWSLRLIWPI